MSRGLEVSRGSSYVRQELEAALARIPEGSYIFTDEDVENIVRAVGSWTKLLGILDGDPVTIDHRAELRALCEHAERELDWKPLAVFIDGLNAEYEYFTQLINERRIGRFIKKSNRPIFQDPRIPYRRH